ncbi:MAG: L-rhamnose mutarotase [Anaerostipes hadrus]
MKLDMAKMAADPETQRWWDECIPCLDPYTEDGPWLDMERVYRLD